VPRPRAFAVLAVVVAAPLWLATSHGGAGSRWRLTLLSSLDRPLQQLHDWASATLSVVQVPALHAENRRLRRALLQERHAAIQFNELTLEVARLRRLLHVTDTLARPTRVARVIGRDTTPWFRTLLVNFDEAAGVPEGAAVVVEQGLVGQILEAGSSAARVLLVTDPRFRVGALVQRSRAQGIALGTMGGRCYLAYITAEDAVRTGDVVLTSGVGGLMPKGLILGTVVRVDRDPSGLYWQAQVQPSVDPAQIEEVVCLP